MCMGQVILACAVSLMSVTTGMYAATGLVCKATCTLSTTAPVTRATLGRPAQRCWTAVLGWIATMATVQLLETATIVLVMKVCACVRACMCAGTADLIVFPYCCVTGYYGNKCEFDNPCECVNNGNCTNGTCQCPSGFTGDKCSQPDHCAASPPPCENGGTCSNGQDGAVCSCAAGTCVCVCVCVCVCTRSEGGWGVMETTER